MFCNTPQPLRMNGNKEYSVSLVASRNVLLYNGVSAGAGGYPDITPIVRNYIPAPDYSERLVRKEGENWLLSSTNVPHKFQATEKGVTTSTVYYYTWGYPPTSRMEIEQEFGNVQNYFISTLPFVVYGPYYKISFGNVKGDFGITTSSTNAISMARAWITRGTSPITLKKTVVRDINSSIEESGNRWPLSAGTLIGENETYKTIVFHIASPANMTLQEFIDEEVLQGTLIEPSGTEVPNPAISKNQMAFNVEVYPDGLAGSTRAYITMNKGYIFRIDDGDSKAVILEMQLKEVTVKRFQSNTKTPDDSITLTELPCSEGFTHCLYFLKLDGSVGWVFVKDKTGGKLNVTRDNYSSVVITNTQAPNGVLQHTYGVEYYRTRSFNTGFLTADQARKLQELFISPRVWMMDLYGNLLGEVIVTDKSFEVKDRRVSDAPVSYTINVREAEDYSLLAR